MARAKNTVRADARRRHREQQRTLSIEPNTLSDDAVEPVEEAPARQSLLRMPDVRADIAALPGMFRTRRLLWIPFLMLLVGFVIDLALRSRALSDGFVASLGVTYWQLILHPTGLFVFFIGGFLAPRGSWLVGLILGVVDAFLLTLGLVIAISAGWTGSTIENALVMEDVVVVWLMAIVLGVLAASFAAWYRNFLRQSQERARINRMNREREQAAKAKEQARKDKELARQASRSSRTTGTTGTTRPGS